jgi:hypothetical protein
MSFDDLQTLTFSEAAYDKLLKSSNEFNNSLFASGMTLSSICLVLIFIYKHYSYTPQKSHQFAMKGHDALSKPSFKTKTIAERVLFHVLTVCTVLALIEQVVSIVLVILSPDDCIRWKVEGVLDNVISLLLALVMTWIPVKVLSKVPVASGSSSFTLPHRFLTKVPALVTGTALSLLMIATTVTNLVALFAKTSTFMNLVKTPFAFCTVVVEETIPGFTLIASTVSGLTGTTTIVTCIFCIFGVFKIMSCTLSYIRNNTTKKAKSTPYLLQIVVTDLCRLTSCFLGSIVFFAVEMLIVLNLVEPNYVMLVRYVRHTSIIMMLVSSEIFRTPKFVSTRFTGPRRM